MSGGWAFGAWYLGQSMSNLAFQQHLNLLSLLHLTFNIRSFVLGSQHVENEAWKTNYLKPNHTFLPPCLSPTVVCIALPLLNHLGMGK